MTAYWRCSTLFAVYIEVAEYLGKKSHKTPFMVAVDNEVILNWSYAQVIITPSIKLKAEKTANRDSTKTKAKKNGRTCKRFSKTHA